MLEPHKLESAAPCEEVRHKYHLYLVHKTSGFVRLNNALQWGVLLFYERNFRTLRQKGVESKY